MEYPALLVDLDWTPFLILLEGPAHVVSVGDALPLEVSGPCRPSAWRSMDQRAGGSDGGASRGLASGWG